MSDLEEDLKNLPPVDLEILEWLAKIEELFNKVLGANTKDEADQAICNFVEWWKK